VLTAAAMDAHNTFASPKAVVPTLFQASVDDGKLVVKLPAKSVAVLAVNE
jgi:alpha-N-arabinofuranosidase